MALLRFSKIQGTGNDLVMIDCRTPLGVDLSSLAIKLCDRHFGIGGDGMIALETSPKADFKMNYFNADGSATTCGNGMRCTVRFVMNLGILKEGQTKVLLETASGLRELEIVDGGKNFRTNMGPPYFDGVDIPTAKPGEHIQIQLEALDKRFTATAVGMGNPHCVIFADNVSEMDISEIGPALEHHPFFPKRTNVEFVEVLSKTHLKMRVWERGVGETLACGTGACGAFAAALKEGRCEKNITLSLLGGELKMEFDDSSGNIFLTGPAEEVYQGVIEI